MSQTARNFTWMGMAMAGLMAYQPVSARAQGFSLSSFSPTSLANAQGARTRESIDRVSDASSSLFASRGPNKGGSGNATGEHGEKAKDAKPAEPPKPVEPPGLFHISEKALPPPHVACAALEKIQKGSGRKEVLDTVGSPAGSITIPSESEFLETFQYYCQDGRRASVKLANALVTSVALR